MIDTRQKWILTAILAAIEIFLTVTNLGYHSIGSIAFTVLHIPIFIATILAGLPQGVLIAGIFGYSPAGYWITCSGIRGSLSCRGS